MLILGPPYIILFTSRSDLEPVEAKTDQINRKQSTDKALVLVMKQWQQNLGRHHNQADCHPQRTKEPGRGIFGVGEML